MNDLPLPALGGLLFLLILCCAFFSGSETGLMTLNRYRLKHRADKGDRGARLAQNLLKRPDRLIGMILLGNTVTIELATIVANAIGVHIAGDLGVAAATLGLAVLLLVFAEVMPKTLAALHPERVGIPASYVYWPLQWLIMPVVFVVNLFSNGVLRVFGVSPEDAAQHSLSSEELRSVVAEAGAMIPQRHQKMLLSILDLEKATVEDIMVPRNEIAGLDLAEPWDKVRERIVSSQHTRVPVFEGSIDNLKGVVHMRRVVRLAADNQLDTDSLRALAREPYFIPEGTPLNQQLLNFQNQKRRIGFVVDEYGDIQGLVTLEDILEEVVGEFTSDPATRIKNVYADADGSYRVSGFVTIRSLNKNLGWKLPTGGPKTVNGLVLEKLENIPEPGKRIEMGGYEFEITETRANAVKTARIRPPRTPGTDSEKKAAA
ncbi:MAG TPA: HlyC/CorC family transporter [Nevskiaceae bacterium]|nr:HlyC/CorC family transporter [Nevskiaceae bacterium]